MELFFAIATKASAQSSSAVYLRSARHHAMSTAFAYLFLQNCPLLKPLDTVRLSTRPLQRISDLVRSFCISDFLPIQSARHLALWHLSGSWVLASLPGISSGEALADLVSGNMEGSLTDSPAAFETAYAKLLPANPIPAIEEDMRNTPPSGLALNVGRALLKRCMFALQLTAQH